VIAEVVVPSDAAPVDPGSGVEPPEHAARTNPAATTMPMPAALRGLIVPIVFFLSSLRLT
jgi:hypothetical protein